MKTCRSGRSETSMTVAASGRDVRRVRTRVRGVRRSDLTADRSHPYKSTGPDACPNPAARREQPSSTVVVGRQAATFGFGEAAPDAVRLAHAQREVEALLLHDALRADLFALASRDFALVAPFGDRRREEQRRLRAAARRLQMPRFVNDAERHAMTPPPRTAGQRRNVSAPPVAVTNGPGQEPRFEQLAGRSRCAARLRARPRARRPRSTRPGPRRRRGSASRGSCAPARARRGRARRRRDRRRPRRLPSRRRGLRDRSSASRSATAPSRSCPTA